MTKACKQFLSIVRRSNDDAVISYEQLYMQALQVYVANERRGGNSAKMACLTTALYAVLCNRFQPIVCDLGNYHEQQRHGHLRMRPFIFPNSGQICSSDSRTQQHLISVQAEV